MSKTKQIKRELVRGPVTIGDWERHSPKTVELVKERRNTSSKDHACHCVLTGSAWTDTHTPY